MLLAPVRQLSIGELAATGACAVAPAALLVVYFCLCLGHAMDRVLEKWLAKRRRELMRSGDVPPALRKAVLGAMFFVELCLLGDYYTSYWPESHPHRPPATVACIVVKWDGDREEEEALLPGTVCYYWRRDINGRILWPTSPERDCAFTDESIWRNVHPGSEAPEIDGGGEAVPLAEVAARIEGQLEHTFLPGPALARLRALGGTSLHLRVRTLEYHGTALRPRRLYDYPLSVGVVGRRKA